MPTRTPFRLKIAYQTVTVGPLSEADRKRLNCEGYYNPETWEIRIRAKTAPAEQVRILLHEIIHACFDLGGWGEVTLNEEIVCNFLDRALTQVFQENPHLSAILALALGPAAQGIFQAPTSPTAPQPALVDGQGAKPPNPPADTQSLA